MGQKLLKFERRTVLAALIVALLMFATNTMGDVGDAIANQECDTNRIVVILLRNCRDALVMFGALSGLTGWAQAKRNPMSTNDVDPVTAMLRHLPTIFGQGQIGDYNS